jgi:glutamate synthase (NADPH/NADH)
VLPKFVKVMPRDYKQALLRMKPTPEKAVVAPAREPVLLDIEESILDSTLALKQVDKVRGFMKYKRQTDGYREVKARTRDWKEVNARLKTSELKVQAARCMGTVAN